MKGISMNEKVGFSVLMSIYINDDVDAVKVAIKSLLDQTLSPDEIVLVIDGPINDLLMKTVRQFQNNNKEIKVIALEKNVGLGNALNIGLEHCSNEYVARMDSDDYSLEYRFEKQIDYIKRHPEIDVLGGQIAEYDRTLQHSIGIREVPITMPEIKHRMPTRNGMNHVTVMYKKEAVLAVGNYQHCPFFEDYYLWCRMIKAGFKFHNLNSVLVNVRTGEEMYQRRGGKKYNSAIVTFQRKILKIGFINRKQFIGNVVLRLIVANMPNRMRAFFYKKKLRISNNMN